MRVAFLSCC